MAFMGHRVGGLMHLPRYHVAQPKRSSFMPTDPGANPAARISSSRGKKLKRKLCKIGIFFSSTQQISALIC